MSFGTAVTPFINTTNATLQAWATLVDSWLLAAGMVNTADTGQTAPSALVVPGLVSTPAGYRIYRSNDAAGALTNFFLRAEFGSGASAVTRPAMWWTMGFGGTDNAGNLLGVTTTRRIITPSADPAGVTRWDYSGNTVIGSGGRFVGSHRTPTLTNQIKFGFERTRNGDGTFRNEVNFFEKSGGVNLYRQAFNPTVVYPAFNAGDGGRLFPGIANTPVAGIAALAVAVGFAPGHTSPLMGLLGVEDLGIGTDGDVLPLPIFGTNRNYKLSNSIDVFDQIATTTHLILYE